jgi:hypothetical protein
LFDGKWLTDKLVFNILVLGLHALGFLITPSKHIGLFALFFPILEFFKLYKLVGPLRFGDDFL